MTVNYPGQSIGGTPAPKTSNISVNSNWLPDMLNRIHSRQLSSTKSQRWLNQLAIIEEDFYGDIIQQYRASFPKAFKYDHQTKPEFTSNWGVNTTVATTQVNWQRVYGIDIDKSELTKLMEGDKEVETFIGNNIQEGINSANLEELALISYGLEHKMKEITPLNRDNAFQELLAEVDSHLGYVINESFISADEEVVVLTDYATSARIRSLPALRYVDTRSRERVLSKIVPVPFLPEVFETVNPITVTQDMIANHCLVENYAVGSIIPVGSLVIDSTHFNSADIKNVLVDKNGKIPNILVYDKRCVFVGKRPTLFNWSEIEGEVNFTHQDLQRGLVSQNTLERSMNVAFCDLFKMKAFRYEG